MLRSVFTKYTLALAVIILVSFLMMSALISSIIGNYAEDAKTDLMERTGGSSAVYLEGLLADEAGEDPARVIERRGESVKRMISSIAAQGNDLTILVTDSNGRILMSVGEDYREVSVGTTLPADLMGSAQQADGFLPEQSEWGYLFENPHYIYTVPFYDGEGELGGTVFVCAASTMLTDLSSVIVRTVVWVSLPVLLASLIAVYLISDRVTRPLREISKAAKSFANGNFDVRVSVRGSDEVAELATAFNTMAEHLENYDTMRNTFISNVSHDLRTPMTSISGFIDGILDGVIPPEKHEYYLRLVSVEVKRLCRLVTSLLDVSKIQAGERKFTPSGFDICEMGRQILISFEQKINEKNLQVSFECEENKMTAVADRDAIYQTLYNLCDNAVKFSKEGGELRLSFQKGKNRRILVSVYNEGQGIPPEDLPYVFERFYKSDKSRGLNKSGVGLGLFIAKSIVEAHHEKIWVESELGKDCCFRFTLPGV